MASKSSLSIIDFEVADRPLRLAYLSRVKNDTELAELDAIFEIALRNRSLFPNINLSGGELTYEHYLERWINSYCEAVKNPPSTRVASAKKSCSDPAIKKIVQTATHIDETEADRQEYYHNLFMSAENAQGSLLEEFIALNSNPLGWLWCRGNVLKAVDFCSSDGKTFLQIKNKSNTENSSSSAIRAGTSIQKWYRLGTQTIRGVLFPSYRWEKLNELINDGACATSQAVCSMSEKMYLEFLTNVANANPKIIAAS